MPVPSRIDDDDGADALLFVAPGAPHGEGNGASSTAPPPGISHVSAVDAELSTLGAPSGPYDPTTRNSGRSPFEQPPAVFGLRNVVGAHAATALTSLVRQVSGGKKSKSAANGSRGDYATLPALREYYDEFEAPLGPPHFGTPLPPPPNSSRVPEMGLLGRQGLRLTVLDRQTTLASYDETATLAHTIGTLGSVGTRSLAPRDLLGLEAGRTVVLQEGNHLVTNKALRRSAEAEPERRDATGAILVAAKRVAPNAKEDPAFFAEHASALNFALEAGAGEGMNVNIEIDWLGTLWRKIFQRLVLLVVSPTNALQYTRAMQLGLFFQTSHEAYLLANVIEAFDRRDHRLIRQSLSQALSNRNISRFLVQLSRARYDWLWHSTQAMRWNRTFDAWGRVPLVGITSFTPSENFPGTRDHALASVFRLLLGPGNWITRVITRGREGLLTNDPSATAQNLAAESNGFEAANRNQYGTSVGRKKTNEFRFHHRLTTDESIVRTYVSQPQQTLLNNGVVHVLRQLARHWENMLSQPWGNFAHQRMEQLDPFDTLRFHIPATMVLLANFRGRNVWDANVLAPVLQQCRRVEPDVDSRKVRGFLRQLIEWVLPISGGVEAIADPLRRWLVAMEQSCLRAEEEAKQVYHKISPVELGIRLGNELFTAVEWKVPDDQTLKTAVRDHILGLGHHEVDSNIIERAMLLTTPRDKRTLIELVRHGYTKTKPAQLLIGRVRTLLQRELRREAINIALRRLSTGDIVQTALARDDWYWLIDSATGHKDVYIYLGRKRGQHDHTFMHVDSGNERIVNLDPGNQFQIRTYIPIAEAITRAQRTFMEIELEHGRCISYSALMEFTYLRVPLRRLVVVSQLNCGVLDQARLNVLREVQRSYQATVSIDDLVPRKTYYTHNQADDSYEPFVWRAKVKPGDELYKRVSRSRIVKVPPQNVVVVGGGPTGLLTVIHTAEAALATGGVVKLFEARDAFLKGGATFERAQIVRLDARWIAMMRYHLGTTFEDVFIPSSGETDAQLGNTLPTQAFVELTIKDMESMLHIEVSKLWSKALVSVYSDSKAEFDVKSNALTKQGINLKEGDVILRPVDENGHKTDGAMHSWKVSRLVYTESLSHRDLVLGNEYGIFIRQEGEVLPFRFVSLDIETRTYTFRSLTDKSEDLSFHAGGLPSVYPPETNVKAHSDVMKIVLEHVRVGELGGHIQDEVDMEVIRNTKFTLHLGQTHIVEAIGKPHGSKDHARMTTTEPYGVCCLQGLKVSLGMHNFGERRWQSGILDDIRSVNDQNTRIIGDFTKMVRVAPIVQGMFKRITEDENWRLHFHQLVVSSPFPELARRNQIIPVLVDACSKLQDAAQNFRRKTLQTRFFETGDNYYVGMEFTREYDTWKEELGNQLVAPIMSSNTDGDNPELRKSVEKLRGLLMHHLDRLWYESCLETIRTGDVYNPGARHRVPRLYTIDSHIEEDLGSLPDGECFRKIDAPADRYEIIMRIRGQVLVRNVEGYLSTLDQGVRVKREGNLTRGPDGNAESNVAIAAFPVAHYVNHRTMRVLNRDQGYVAAFVGDEQATPHFMRYSGLTGACINVMSFNQFLRKSLEGQSFQKRFEGYSQETNWSNGEVVQRGTGANYGIDGFLRPGFSYSEIVAYLHSKVIEYMESGQDLETMLSDDWKVKLAASMVPKGMEMNEPFRAALRLNFLRAVLGQLVVEIENDNRISKDIVDPIKAIVRSMNPGLGALAFWNAIMELDVDESTKPILVDFHLFISRHLCVLCDQIIDFARDLFVSNKRIASELFNQPKAVDSVVDDFAVEAQNFANALTESAAYSAGVLSFSLLGATLGYIASFILGIFNINISFATMTNVSRYKIRNEEARIQFWDEKFVGIKKAVFSLIDRPTQDKIPSHKNPFMISLQKEIDAFLKDVEYYNIENVFEFNRSVSELLGNIHDVDTILSFQNKLASQFIPDTFHVNSYVQESLVRIFKTVDEMLYLLSENRKAANSDSRVDTASTHQLAMRLFEQLQRFEPHLKDSLQDGPVRWGFVKQRKFAHWDIMVALRYFYSLVCRGGVRLGVAPIQTETRAILNQARRLSTLNNGQVLRREIRDLESLFWATRESDIASLIFLAVLLVFVASVVFTIARIFSISVLLDLAFWAIAASSLGAILAFFHFVRKIYILLRLYGSLGRRRSNLLLPSDQVNLNKVLSVTWTQILLTFTRLLTAAGAAVALPFAVVENGYGDQIRTLSDLPFWIGLGSFGAAVASIVFLFIVEFSVRYNLPVEMGAFIGELFRDEIEGLKRLLIVPTSQTEPEQVHERELWEYTAREFLHIYRFDTVFAADRFGNILQYIQGGMVTNKNAPINGVISGEAV